jgi:hypothetical protein
MKIEFVFPLAFMIICNLSCNNIKPNNKNSNQLNDFEIFANKFQDKSLPFSIDNNKNFYPRLVFDSIKVGYKESSYKSIDTSEYKFLNLKTPDQKVEFDNRYGVRLFHDPELTILLTFKDSLWSDVYNSVNQVVLNTFYKNKFENSIVFAGSNSPTNTVFGSIDLDKNIIIRTFTVKPSSENREGIFARETHDYYKISKTGKIIKSKTDFKDGYFSFENGSYKSIK